MTNKYYQKSKEKLQKKHVKDLKIFLKKKKTKDEKLVLKKYQILLKKKKWVIIIVDVIDIFLRKKAEAS